MISLQQYLTTGLDLFEEGYKKIKCKYKVNGKWERARISLKTGIIYNMDGQVLRRCHVIKN